MSIIPLDVAAQLLAQGAIVGIPTETVYGLAANALNGEAVAKIYAQKNRPQFNPLIVHFASARDASTHVEWNARAEKLSATFWPGPLTLVLPRKTDSTISLLVSAGLDSLAIRVPAHAKALALIQQSGTPLAAPSANRSGRVSPTTPAHVLEEFANLVPVVDGGACEVGLESTVVDLRTSPTILRPGSITQEALENALGESVPFSPHDEAIAAPGMLKSHYAPTLPLRLNAETPLPGEAYLAFGASKGTLSLSESGDLQEAAAKLFAYLRKLDTAPHTGIAVAPIPMEGIGTAINDRLARAASK